MSINWDLKNNTTVPVLTEQMVSESTWWANNRFAAVKEPYPIDKTVPFKKMSKSGLDDLIKSVSITDDVQKGVDAAREKAIKRYENAVFDPKDMEIEFGRSERYPNDMWLAYLHYSKEQHDIQTRKYADEKLREKDLRDHIRQHGQLVKNG